MRRRRNQMLKKITSVFGIAMIILTVVIGLSVWGIFQYKDRIESEIAATIQECVFLPSDSEMIEYTKEINDIKFTFNAPEFIKGNSEEVDNQLYLYANPQENLRTAFYLYIFTDDEKRDYQQILTNHKGNSLYYDYQELKNNNHIGFYIQSKNITNAQNIMTIQHTEFCGKTIEFSCAAMCHEKFATCEEIFDSLKIECLNADPTADETYSTEYEQVVTTGDGEIIEDDITFG